MDKLNMVMVDRVIKAALEEDINYFDITTDNLIGEQQTSEAIMLAKEDGVICGIGIAARVFYILDETVEFVKLKHDGDIVCKGEIIARIGGSTRAILKGERTALNIMQRLSGIATKTHGFAQRVKDYDVKIVDTRKTTPKIHGKVRCKMRRRLQPQIQSFTFCDAKGQSYRRMRRDKAGG